MIDTKGKLDPSLKGRPYYGNARRKPNDHCVWIEESITPGWFATLAHHNELLTAKLKRRGRL